MFERDNVEVNHPFGQLLKVLHEKCQSIIPTSGEKNHRLPSGSFTPQQSQQVHELIIK